MIKSISPKTTQGDMLAMLEKSGARVKATSNFATNVVHVDFSKPSAVAFLRMYCAMTNV